MDQAKMYFHSAYGAAFTGHISRPFEHIIDVQAGACLLPSGGYGESRVSDFRYKEIVSFKSGHTQVSGSQDAKTATNTTFVTSTIENLDILGVVTADRVVVRLSSEQGASDPEPSIAYAGCHFENLRIAGNRVDVNLNLDLFTRLNTFQAMLKELEINPDFRKMAEDPFQTGQPRKLPDASGAILCSLLEDNKAAYRGLTRQGHTFIVPQFGKVFLAEVLAQRGKRTLSMVRVEMDSSTCGCTSSPVGVINGVPW